MAKVESDGYSLFGLMMMIGHGLGKWQHYSELAKTWDVAPAIWPLSKMSGSRAVFIT